MKEEKNEGERNEGRGRMKEEGKMVNEGRENLNNEELRENE